MPTKRILPHAIAVLCALAPAAVRFAAAQDEAKQPARTRAARPNSTPGSTRGVQEIPVKLFGQPCMLRGPVSEATLKLIHAYSPEQFPPPQNEEQAKAILDRFSKATDIPESLDRYKERMIKRMEAQIAFFQGASSALKAKKPDPLIEAMKKYTGATSKGRAFDSQVRKIISSATAPSPAPGATAMDQLNDAFEDLMEPQPEEEFHRAIRHMDVEYNCSFEEQEGE